MKIAIDKIRSKQILVIGDLMLDIYLQGKANRISPEAPVPVVFAERQEHIPGGAANVMSNLRVLGCKVVGVGFLGDDAEGKFLLNSLQAKGVTTESIITTALPTIYKTRVIADGQHIVRFDFDTDFSEISEHSKLVDYVEILATQQFDAVVISDYCKGTITEQLVEVIKKNYLCPIIVDTKPQHKSYFNKVCCITPNLGEAKQMVGDFHIENPWEISRRLKYEMELDSIIITLADKGMLLIDDNKELSFDAYVNFDNPTQRFDVTGAGDTVISVFSACVAAGIAKSEAAYAANVAAGIVVSKTGTAVCTYNELVQEIKNNGTRSSSKI